MSAFIRLLWSGRKRREPNPQLQERIARYTTYPPHRNVVAAPKDPPVRRGSGFRNG